MHYPSQRILAGLIMSFQILLKIDFNQQDIAIGLVLSKKENTHAISW